MVEFTRLRALFKAGNTEDDSVMVTRRTVVDSKHEGAAGDVPQNQDEAQTEVPSEDTQRGVHNVEALTLTWSKRTLIAVFINIWFLYLVNAFQSTILSSLLPFVTSKFESHSLLNVIYVVSNAMCAATYIPLAKIMDLWGRAEGFLIMTVFATVGLQAHSQQVFYSIGFGGMTYCMDVITADASKLKNRGLAYAFTSSPYIITAFAGPKAAEDFYYKVNWRWGFGCFAIIFPAVAAPLYFMLKFNLRKAVKQGLTAKGDSGRTFLQKIWHYIIEFDLFGVVIFSAGLIVFLLPFEIAGDAPHGWSTGYVIAMIVVGFVMLIIFILHEVFLAPAPMLNFSFISDRTVIGACLLDATYQISYSCWANYYTSFLQVVNDLTLAESGYVMNTFDVVSGVLLLIVGFLISRTGRFKWLLYISVPLYVFAQGLMIYFRRPNQSVGYLVMCQIFISIGGSVFIIVQQLAILAAVDHQHVAAVLALLNVVGTVGGAMGSNISGAIWTNTFKKALIRDLPSSEMGNLDSIYENLDTQLEYPVGSVTRLAIQEAYAYAQTRMLAAGTGVIGLAFVWILLIRNIDLAKVQQVK
ncbi:siderophore iron transporter mirB, partial [Aspergillus campestris IBT 28561]